LRFQSEEYLGHPEFMAIGNVEKRRGRLTVGD
jgi:hypothetical protein